MHLAVKPGYVRIMFPQFRDDATHVRLEASGIAFMEIPYGGCEHDRVAKTEIALENQFLHREFFHLAGLASPLSGAGRNRAYKDLIVRVSAWASGEILPPVHPDS